MRRMLLIVFVPPLAACKFACKSCCAAPIGVFWLTAIVAIVYGVIWGGPVAGYASHTVLGGIGLWALASIWAGLVIRGRDADRCQEQGSSWCSTILPTEDEVDPLDEIRRVR